MSEDTIKMAKIMSRVLNGFTVPGLFGRGIRNAVFVRYEALHAKVFSACCLRL
jgi:hypothetical protein